MVLEGTFGASAIHTAPLLLRAQYRLTLLCTLAQTLLLKKLSYNVTKLIHLQQIKQKGSYHS